MQKYVSFHKDIETCTFIICLQVLPKGLPLFQN